MSTRSLLISVLVFAFLWAGCSKKESAPTPTKKEPAARPPARTEKPARPRAEEPRAPRPRPPDRARATPPAARTPAAPPPARKMEKSEFKSTVKRPAYPVIYKFVRGPGVTKVIARDLSPLGGARFVSVVQGVYKKSKKYWFRLVTVEKKGEEWKLVSSFLLDAPKKSKVISVKPFRAGASMKVADFDWDGKPEARIRYRYTVKGHGGGEIRKAVIVNLDGPKPRIAWMLTLYREYAANIDEVMKTKGYFKFRDLNNDKHPDLVVSVTDREFAPNRHGGAAAAKTKTVTHYIWDWKTDTYKKGKSKKKSWTSDM